MGFKETQLQTIQSVHIGMPHLFIEKGGLCLSAKRFRADGFRMNRWDLYVSRLERSGFTPFERVSEHFGAPDTGYAVLESPQGLISMAAVYNEKDMCREFETHAEVILIADERLPRIDPPKALRDHYQWAYSAAGLGREIAMPLTVPHYTALRGDVHNHTLYSKCMSSPDGAPDEAVRYYLDILGMNLLCFTDHTDRIGFAQHTWTIDRLEELAGDEAVVLYGMEPSAAPDHDTNYYAATRQEAERLRLCTLYSLRRDKVYRSIRHHMPEGRAAAIRHCHGRIDGACGIYTNQTLTTHMPDLEWGMEALQLRGNLILGESFENPERHFPCNFLNSGAKLALLGGTDHDLQMVLNHVGYTGFWAEDTSARAALRAIRQRKTYAVANGLLQLWTEWDGRPMGSEMGLQQRVAIHYQVAAARPIRAVALLCDGELLPWQPVEPALNVNGLLTDEAPTTGPHWYSVVVKGDSFFTEDTVAARMPLAMAGAGQVRNDCCMAFASPYFVTLSNNGFYHK